LTRVSAGSIDASADVASLSGFAQHALEQGEEESALPVLERAAVQTHQAILWRWKGLLERSLDEHELALASFAKAADLAPNDVGIAHGHARVAMEAGLDARPLYERAMALQPQNGELLVGQAAALAAMGDAQRAIAGLSAVLERAPAWTYGHEQFAQLLSTQGRGDEATLSLDAALERFPDRAALWETLLAVQLRRGDYASLAGILERARAAGVRSTKFHLYDGVHAAEFSQETHPNALFAWCDSSIDKALAIWRIRHLLRVGALDAALPLIDEQIRGNPSAEFYSYAATAWRLAGDPRWHWLEGNEKFVQSFDLKNALPPLQLLADKLHSLHVAKGEYLDQSVRGGTQTDGPLFSRVDPVIRQVRCAVVGAVEKYVAQLPPIDPSHPLLRERRDRKTRFSGSWSVRLRGGGRHSNHVHPLGWISSALYVVLPNQADGEASDAGWLTLGEPDDRLQLSLTPSRAVRPEPGRLVLFPSWMWHGTRPFAAGERLTIAFDVAVPR